MENVNKFMFKNFLIMFGVFVFTVILTQLIANQRHTLDAIKKEIEGKAERLKDKHPLLFNEINSAFEDLYKRHTSSLSLLDKMMAAVWSGCIISFAAFVCYTFNCFFP